MKGLTITLLFLARLACGQDISDTHEREILLKPRQTLSIPDSLFTRKFDSLTRAIPPNAPRLSVDSINALLNLPKQNSNSLFHDARLNSDAYSQELEPSGGRIRNSLDETQPEVEARINAIHGSIAEETGRLQLSLQKKISNAPGSLLVDKTGTPDSTLGLPREFQVPETNIPYIPALDVNIPDSAIPVLKDIKIPDYSPDLNSITERVHLDLPSTDKLDNISGEVEDIGNKISEVQAYEEELQAIKDNGLAEAEQLPGEIENKVENIEGMQELNKAQGKITEYQDIIQRYKDEKLIKQEIERKIKMVANDKLNKFSPAVKEAQEQIAKANKLRLSIPSFKQYLKRTPNEMKGKPFMQRFVPGLTIQTYNADKFSTDLALQTGYRVSGRLTTGLGYTCRLSVDKENVNWVADEQISGYRFYTDMRLLKSIYVHGEFEYLTHNGIKQSLIPETLSPGVYGSYFGLGKRYSISRKLKGSIVGLYRVNYSGSVFGVNKLTMRVGIDLDLKKQKKKVYGGKTFRQE